MTKNISDIFLPISAFDGSFIDLHVLIDGAPGIGKTAKKLDTNGLKINY